MTLRQDYMFENATDEERRLLAQARVLDPHTARLFDAAGLAPESRVLDLGSGAGSVAMLAATAVGPAGSVVGVDHDPDAVARAQTLADKRGFTNIEFRTGDVNVLDEFEDGFDAVVGRTVLMHLAEPERALARARTRLRSGGLVCMHEPDMTYEWACPSTPAWQQVRTWIFEVFERYGVDARMGLSLASVFQAAGLQQPRMLLEAHAGFGDDSPTFGWANVMGGLLPLLEETGIATAEEVMIDTLSDRLNAELDAHGGYSLGPLMFGAWARLPGADS